MFYVIKHAGIVVGVSCVVCVVKPIRPRTISKYVIKHLDSYYLIALLSTIIKKHSINLFNTHIMKALTEQEQKNLTALASIARAGQAIFDAATLNNVSIDEIVAICVGMAKRYERDAKK